MKLLIVESPTKAKTLTKYLKGFKVIASNGHIIDLPPSEIGVDLENQFEPKYVTIKGKEKVVEQLKKEAAKAEEIYIGADPDREGEAIAYHVASLFEKESRRVLFHEITKNGVIKAIENFTQLDESLYHAQQARRILDRIVGYKLSPFLWRSVKKGLSAGRVQSVALKLIVERERAIRAFVPEEYWNIQARFKSHDGIELDASLEKVDGKKAKIGNGKEADELEKLILSSGVLSVINVEKKKKKEKPLPPFNTSNLQQEASRNHHYTTEKIMMIAQSLYEGKDIGDEGTTGLITYMRTDSFRISDEANDALRSFLETTYGGDYLHSSVRRYANKKGKTQDAHEAIRPTRVDLTPDKVKPFLTKDEYNIYNLIWKRFVATQMSDAIIDQTSISIGDDAGRVLFKKSGSVLSFDGYRKVYKRSSKDELLPDIKEGTKMSTEKVEKSQHFTKPPARFSEGSLVKELEEKGVGRPSTYASIIKQIVARKYVERLKEPRGALGSTELGEIVSDTLQRFFDNIINVDFTAGMEESLDRIEEGNEGWVSVLDKFYGEFSERLERSLVELKEVGKLRVYAEEPCPKCKSKLVLRWSKKSNVPFLSCEAYPDCDFTSDYERKGNEIHMKESAREEPELLDEKCEKCGSPMVMKEGRYGKFKACSGYPKCKNIVSIEEVIGPCPKCDEGKVVKKRSKRGKVFYGCNRYPECDFVSWYQPVEGAVCSKCGGKYIIEKKKGMECQLCGEPVEATE